MNCNPHQRSGSFEREVNHQRTSVETRGTVKVGNERHALIVPQEDDIEKSFRVNQDGSMTVEMKVHLTIKEEEMLHWTTTVSRSSLSKRAACSSISESGRSSPDSNNAFAKDSSSVSEDDTKEENHPAGAGKGVGFNDGQVYESYTPTTLGKAKTSFKRTPTPGPQRVSKKASVESVKTVTETGVQESTLGHYSYMERTADGETTEGYCVVRHSSSNTKPVPKPRKTASAGANKKGSHSSIRSSGLAEVLQIENNGMEVRETVMHIYESQGCYDNYYANEEYSADGAAAPESKPSTVPSSNDIDFSTTDSLQRPKEEMLSLSSEPITHKLTTASNSQIQGTENKDKTPRADREKKVVHPSRNQKSSTSSSDKKQKESPSKQSKRSSTDKLRSNTGTGKKSLNSSESANSGQKSRGAEKPQSQKVKKDEKTPRKEQALSASTDNLRRTPSLRKNLNEAAAKDNGHNVNTPTGRPQMKKNILDILQPKKSLLPGKKTISKPKSMIENRTSTPKKSSELGESFSMPSLNPSPSEIHQYVENWLEKADPESAPYTEEDIADVSEPQTKVVFQIGGDSESDETNGCQTSPDEENPPPADAVKKSASCLSVPHCHAAPATALPHNEQYARGLCVSMPSVRVDPGHQENRVRAHKSAEAIGPAANESASSEPSALSPKARIRPVLQQLCSSVQCIRNAPETSTTSNLEKSNSLPDFPTQVASVFGSSCKAFLSFLSVMTLRDNLTPNQSRSGSEAMLMMESLQKISTMEDEAEQRASLTDLQSSASSQLREHWKDFQILRERLESEPLSPRVSETEFALDVVSEGGDVFEDQHMVIDELMEELNMPQDLREQISSTIQQARSFYPVDESTFIEIEKDQSETDEDVEKFVEGCETPEPGTTCTAEGIIQTKHDGQQGMLNEAEQEADKVQEMDIDVKESELSQTGKDEPLEERENAGEQAEEEDGEPKEIDDGSAGEETEIGENESEEEAEQAAVTEVIMDDNGQEEWEEEKGNEEETVGKVEEGIEEEMTVDEEAEAEESDVGEKEVVEEIDEGIMDDDDEELREEDNVEDTDEREGEEEIEEEEREDDEVVVEVDAVTGETDEGERVDNIEEEGEEEEVTLIEDAEDEAEEGTVENEEEEMAEVIDERVEEEEVENVIEEVEEEEEEEDTFIEDAEEEAGEGVEEQEEEKMAEVIEGREEVEEGQNVIEKMEEEEEEEDTFIEEADKEAGEDIEEEEEMTEVTEEKEEVEIVMEEIGEEEEEKDVVTEKDAVIEEEGEEMEEVIEEDAGEDVEEGGEDVEVKIEDRVVTDEEEEEQEADKTIDEEEECDEGEECRKESSVEEESVEEKDVVEEAELEGDAIEQILNKGVTGDDEDNESNEFTDGSDEMEERAIEEERVSGDAGSIAGEILLEEAAYLQEQSSCEEEANVDAKVGKQDTESPTKQSSEGQCEDEKGNGTDTVHELETDEERRSSLPHPVEISQELLDFVNSALQSSSLIFTYDAQGKIRIEPDNARVVQTKTVIPRSREDSSYGLKRLPSPITSDLSDYRPETSESGGYKSQDSVDIVTESGDSASEKPPLTRGHKADISSGMATVQRGDSKLSSGSRSEALCDSRLKTGGSFSSLDSGTKASREDLSYFSGASSQKADNEAAPGAAQCVSLASEKDSTDGVLIDRGRWLLKENHLIRKSPPVSLGMYGNADSSSMDTGQENLSEDSLSHCKAQPNPLAAISSSELEEMAKPQTPKCTYYNMPHGSDSDPFMDDSSYKSGKRDSSSARGRGVRVSPTIDTSRTWASKNGSMSSFASVEFKIADRKVHPEGESSAVTRARRTSSGGGRVLQAQDSLDTLHVRCGQYCPIL